MRTLEQRLSYERLELIPHQPKQQESLLAPVTSLLATMGQWFVTAMSSAREPKIWTTTSSTGDPIWTVSDPHTGTFTTFASEADVRVWLEERYYHR